MEMARKRLISERKGGSDAQRRPIELLAVWLIGFGV
jgi:hypothetical protein